MTFIYPRGERKIPWDPVCIGLSLSYIAFQNWPCGVCPSQERLHRSGIVDWHLDWPLFAFYNLGISVCNLVALNAKKPL